MATLDDIDAFFDALVDGGNDEEETGAGGGGGEENEDGSSMALLHPSGGSPSSCLLGESSTLNLDRLRSPDFSLSPGNSSFLPHTSSLLGVEKDASLHTASHVGLGNIHQLRHTALPPAVSTPGVSTANRLHSQPSSSSSLPPVSSSSGGFEAGRVVSGGQDHSSSLDGRGKPIFPSEGIPQRQGHTPGDGVRTLERGLPGGVYTPGNSSQGKGDVGGVLGGENHEAQRGRYVLGGASAGAQDMRQVETSTKGLVASSLPTSTALSDGSLLHAVTSSSSFGVKNRQEGGDHQQGQCSTSSSSYSTRVLSDSTAKKLGTSSSAHSLISPSPRFDLTSPKPTGESTLGPLSGDGVHTARILEVPPSLSSSSSAQITAPHLAKDVPRSFLSPQHQGNASLSSSASSIPPSFSSLHPTSAPGHPQSSSLASHPLSSSSSSLSSDSSSLSLDPRKTYSQPPSKHASLQYGQDGHGVGRSSSSSSSSPSGLSMPHPSSSVGSFPPYPPFAMHPHPSLHPAAPSSHFLSRHPRLIVPLSKELAEEEGGVLGGEKKRGFLVNLGQDGSGPPEFTVPPSLLVPSLSPGPIGQGEGGEEEQDRGEGERDITLQQSMAFCSQTVSRLIQAKLLENDQMLYAVHENLSAGRYEEAVCFFERLQQNLFFLAMLADQQPSPPSPPPPSVADPSQASSRLSSIDSTQREHLFKTNGDFWSHEELQRLHHALRTPNLDLRQLSAAVRTKTPQQILTYLTRTVTRHLKPYSGYSNTNMVFPGPVGGMSKEGEGEKKAQGVSPPAPSSQATTQEILPVGHGGPAQGGGAPQTGSQQMSGASGGGGSVAHRSSSRTAPQPSSSSQPTTSFSNPGASKFGASGGEKVAGGGDGATEGDRSGRTQAAGGSQGREGQSIDSAAYPSTQVQLAVDHDNRKRSIANPSNQMDNSYQHQAPALSSSTSQHLEGRQQTNLTAFSGMLSGHSQRPDTQEPPQASPSMTQGPAAQRNLSILQQEPQSTLSSQLHQGNSTQQQQQQASHHQVVQTVGKGVDGGRGLPSGEGGKEQEQYYQTSKRLCQDRALSSSVEMKERQAQVYHQSQSSHNSSSHTGVHTHQPPSHTSSKAIDQQTAPHHVESSITAPTSEQQLTRQPENSTGGVVAREGGSTQPGVALLRHSGSQGPGALPSSPASNEVVYQAQFRQTVTSLEPKQDEIPYSSSSASNMGQNQKSPSLAATPYHQRAVGTAVGGAPGAPAGQCQQGLLPLSMSRPSFQSQSHRGSFSGSTPAVGSSRDFQDLQGRQQSETSQEAVALGQNSVDHRFSPSPQQHSYYNPSYYSPAQGENRNSREQLTLQQQQQQKTGAVVMQGHAHSSRETQSCQGPSSAQTPSHSLPVQNQSRPSEDAHPLRFQEGTRQHQQVFDMAGQTQAELFRRQHREMQRLPGEAQLGEPLHQASLPHQRGEVAGEGSKMTRQSHITQQPETESHLVNQTSFRQGVHSLQQQPQAGQYASVQQRAMSHQEQHQSSRVSPGQQTTQEDRQVRAYNAGQSASPGVQIQQGGSVPQGLRHSERSHDSQAQLTSAQGGVSKHQIPQIQSTMAGGQGAVPYSPAPPQGSPHLTASNSMAGSQPDPDFGLQQQNRVFVQAGGRIQPPHKLLSPYSQTPER